MKTDTATYPALCHTSASALPLYAPFILLIRWMLGWAAQGAPTQCEVAKPVFVHRHQWVYQYQPPNRKARRRPARRRKPGHDLRPFFSLLSHSLSKAQFLEKAARLSSIGRMALYGFRYWHKVRLSMTKLSPFDFGGWNTPLSAIQADGLWDVHTVPS